jgi:hypothetical protein
MRAFSSAVMLVSVTSSEVLKPCSTPSATSCATAAS